jgi:D-alanyl-D-alanine carboxypeptidase
MPRLAWVDELAVAALSRHDFPGLSIGISAAGQVLHASGYGVAKVAPRHLASEQTHYLIGSVTKQFTAAAFLLLVDRDIVGLGTQLSAVFPELTGPVGCVHFSHLLNHTSGLAEIFDRQLHESGTGLLRNELLATLNSDTSGTSPASEWRYCNTGYYLLALAIERLTGVTSREYLQSMVLDPAGLTQTHFLEEDLACADCARGFRASGAAFGDVSLPNPDATRGSGDLISTVGDLLRWTEALHSGDVVPTFLLDQMRTPQANLAGTPLTYGYGLFIANLAGHREISHDGASSGFSAQVAHYPEDAVTVAVLTNGAAHVSELIEKRITRRLLALPNPDLLNIPTTPDEIMSMVGAYTTGTAGVEVKNGRDGIAVRSPSGTWSLLRHQGGGVFVAQDEPGLTFRFAWSSGKSSGFTVERGGKFLSHATRCEG